MNGLRNFVVALVGRPNVGKSTLFNVLTRSRDALVADFAGLTRDRKYGHVMLTEQPFVIIDTGGLSGEKEALDAQMQKQTRLAVDEADCILFMVDAREGLTPADEIIAGSLRRTGKPVVLVVNKTDGLDARTVSNDFYQLGMGQPVTIAASQNRGVKKLLATIEAHYARQMPDAARSGLVEDTPVDQPVDRPGGQDEGAASTIRVAIVGRPNAGKSTLINRFLGEERVVVFDMPGTTRDSIDVPFQRDDQHYTFIDTAGVRRKRAVKEAVEKFSVIKAMQAIDSANVVIVVIDARTEIADQDLHLVGYVIEAGKALILAINKWDGLDDYQKEQIRAGIDKQLAFVRFAETFFISALHGSGVGKLYGAIQRACQSAMRHFPTPELTRLLEQAVQAHQPPMIQGRRIKLRYAHQGGMNPPRIIIHGNQVEKVPAAYQRYLMNFFRQRLKLPGTPIRIEFKGGQSNPFQKTAKKRDAAKTRHRRHS